MIDKVTCQCLQNQRFHGCSIRLRKQIFIQSLVHGLDDVWYVT